MLIQKSINDFYKMAENQDEKNKIRSSMFDNLTKINDKYKTDEIEIDIKKEKKKRNYTNIDSENIKQYKREYYLRNIETYRQRNKINNKKYRDRKKAEKEKNII